MVKKYLIRRINGIHAIDGEAAQKAWEATSPLLIDQYPWDKTGYRPLASAKIFYSQEGLFVFLQAREENIRAVNTRPNSPVCQDSCLEFFVNPTPEKNEKYINFEINPLGAMLLHIGTSRFDRKPLPSEAFNRIKIFPHINSPDWGIRYFVPFALFKESLGPIDFEPNHILKGNVYKCGDLTRTPHYGCWNPVTAPAPDFHRPECFGELILE